MSVGRSLFLLAILIIALPFFVFANAVQPQSGANNIQLSNLQLYQVGRGTVAFTVTAIGSIEAEQMIALSFLTAGQVDAIFVQRDAYVLAGDELIQLDNESQRIAYEQALLGLENARLAYQDLETVDDNDILL